MELIFSILPIIIGTVLSSVGIFIYRKFEFIQKLTSMYPTIILVGVFALLGLLKEPNVAILIGFFAGPIISSVIAVLILNKFKFNKDEFWPALFTILLFFVIPALSY